jgi:Rap1a immunity proteins
MTVRKWIVNAVLAGTLGLASAQLSATSSGLTPDEVKLKSAGDLVEICSVDSAHADYGAALGFCYGFFEGAIRYQEAIAGTDVNQQLICAPQGTTRLQAVEVFVGFIRENPQYATEGSIDAIYRALMARWPCPAPK